ncbi:hypothetical protein GOP47_0003047 [Adiantum capillus-veneris]|uniref:Hcy-binding domain-containing protein n=1 Tax=Adiantum capillus-veneris TaxID=13818 RepID=A0A9D4ZPQ7_ADICA|nr:hypothetical protein GOP47_0003047 [Adiantum capillus-veneris]
MTRAQRFQQLLKQAGGCLIIDGGLATHLEHLGANINDPLWSALCLLNNPELIRQVHWEFLEAGAQIIITASYQATIPGFCSKGLSLSEAEELLRRSVLLALEARDAFWKYRQGAVINDVKLQPALVSASIGSYGAFLADGSEYSGNYGPEITLESLKDFHRRRLQILVEAKPDLIAFETTPNRLETQAYVDLLREESIDIPAWITFNSKDGINVVSGDSFEECVKLAASSPGVIAVGINCTPPRFIHGLILAAKEVTTKPIVIYPNSGETWDGDKKEWVPSTGVSDVDFVSYVWKWKEAGASLIGGCCRTTPKTIKGLTEALKKQ